MREKSETEKKVRAALASSVTVASACVYGRGFPIDLSDWLRIGIAFWVGYKLMHFGIEYSEKSVKKNR